MEMKEKARMARRAQENSKEEGKKAIKEARIKLHTHGTSTSYNTVRGVAKSRAHSFYNIHTPIFGENYIKRSTSTTILWKSPGQKPNKN